MRQGGACALPGCHAPTAQNRVACRMLHHMLIMALRYLSIGKRRIRRRVHRVCGTSSSSSSSFRAGEAENEEEVEEGATAAAGEGEGEGVEVQRRMLDDYVTEGAHLCALPFCNEGSWPGHRWCSRTHYVSWVTRFCSSLGPVQICKLPSCTRHVFVDFDFDKGIATDTHSFCGWRHCQEYHMGVALGRINAPSCFTSVNKGRYPCEPSREILVSALKAYASNQCILPKGINVDVNFFSKHPWEVLQNPVQEFCWLLARCTYTKTGSKREWITKENYHWSQEGPPKKFVEGGNTLSRRHFTYEQLSQKTSNTTLAEKGYLNPNNYLFSMTEWTVAGCKDHCIVRLTAQVPPQPSPIKRRKVAPNDQSSKLGTPPGVTTKSVHGAGGSRVTQDLVDLPPVLPVFEELPTLSSAGLSHIDPLHSDLFENTDSPCIPAGGIGITPDLVDTPSIFNGKGDELTSSGLSGGLSHIEPLHSDLFENTHSPCVPAAAGGRGITPDLVDMPSIFNGKGDELTSSGLSGVLSHFNPLHSDSLKNVENPCLTEDGGSRLIQDLIDIPLIFGGQEDELPTMSFFGSDLDLEYFFLLH